MVVQQMTESMLENSLIATGKLIMSVFDLKAGGFSRALHFVCVQINTNG